MNDVVQDVKTVGSKTKLLVRGGIAVAAVGALALALPLVWFAFLSTLGLYGIGILGLLAFGIVKALPLFGQKLENRLMAARLKEAREHPIEQMNNRILQKRHQLDAFKIHLTNIGGMVTTQRRMLEQRHQQDPGHDLTDMRKAVEKMDLFYQQLGQKYAEANKAFLLYCQYVDRKKFEHGWSQTAGAALTAMNVDDADNLLQDMLADESFKSIEQDFDRTFAALDVESRSLTDQSKMDFGKGVVLDVSAIRIPVEAK